MICSQTDKQFTIVINLWLWSRTWLRTYFEFNSKVVNYYRRASIRYAIHCFLKPWCIYLGVNIFFGFDAVLFKVPRSVAGVEQVGQPRLASMGGDEAHTNDDDAILNHSLSLSLPLSLPLSLSLFLSLFLCRRSMQRWSPSHTPEHTCGTCWVWPDMAKFQHFGKKCSVYRQLFAGLFTF